MTARTGWRLDGQFWGPRLDDNPGSGVVDNGSAWPGTSIEETTDGGTNWSTILHIASGIWGIDLVSRNVGFAVGVTSLRITSDGGKRWRQASEPAGRPLVWVEFNTSKLGYGLTTTGTLVRTVADGSSWSSTRMTTTATAAWVGYVADRSGDLYATHDGGRSWAEVERGPCRPEQFSGPWSALSCNGTSIWLGLQLICAAACAATSPYLVTHSADGGSSWSTMASDWPAASPTTAPVAYLAAVAAGWSDRGVVVDLPTEDSSPPTKLRLIASQGPDNTYTTATIPALPASSSAALELHICGMTLEITPTNRAFSVGLLRLELRTSALSVLRSNQLSYSPDETVTLHQLHRHLPGPVATLFTRSAILPECPRSLSPGKPLSPPRLSDRHRGS